MPSTESDSKTSFRSKFPAIDWALVVLFSIYLIAVVTMWWAIHNRTGEISYTLDDSYIHGTVAKNLAANGTFGIVPGEFSAASSSPLWTLMLGVIFFVTGPQSWIAAALATLFGGLTVERSNSLLKSVGVGPVVRVVVVAMALAYAPILPIVSTGMEHTFQAWALLGLFCCLIDISRGLKKPGQIFLWALLAAGARYESLFALPPLLVWLALRRKWSSAFELGLGMAVPVLGFALYSVLHGGYALPYSVMLKGNLAGAFKIKAFRLAVETQYIFIVMLFLSAAALVSIIRRKRHPENLAWLPISGMVMMLIHLQLAQLGWFYRYEAYLIILGLVSAATFLAPLGHSLRGRPFVLRMTVYILLAFATLPLVWRAKTGSSEIIRAAGNIHDQQRQMSEVARRLGKNARVAVNDLGAVSFFSDALVLDLWGLGDNKIGRAKVNRVFGAETLKTRLEETRTDFVICYPYLFMGSEHLPTTLIPVATWVLGENLICGGDTVVFYGTTPEAAAKLTATLEAYRSETVPNPQSTNRMYPASPP
ncbi:MAG: hypothetical protein V4819_22415 [Verrucomicrobiota bacterium]